MMQNHSVLCGLLRCNGSRPPNIPSLSLRHASADPTRWHRLTPKAPREFEPRPTLSLSFFADFRSLVPRGAGISPVLSLTEAVEEERVISDSFFDELFDEEQLGTVDDGMDALLEGLHGGESLK